MVMRNAWRTGAAMPLRTTAGCQPLERGTVMVLKDGVIDALRLT